MATYEIRANEKYNSNEVYFTSKPGDDIRAALKALHMIWNHKKGCWYGFIAAEKITAAIEKNAAAAGPAPEHEKTSEPVTSTERTEYVTVKPRTKTEDILKAVNAAFESPGALADLKLRLEDDLRKETAAARGAAPSRIKLIEKLLKNANDQTAISKGYTIWGDRKVFCDSYRAYFTTDDHGFKAIKETQGDEYKEIDFAKIWHRDDADQGAEIDINDLKSFIKIQKSEKAENPIYIVGEGDHRIGFNPKYLLEMLQFTGKNMIVYSDAISPAYIGDLNDDVCGLLLPVRIK